MFESTIGFSAAPIGWDIKPEHTYNNEIAYVYNHDKLFSEKEHASIKLAYFHHRTKDVIERGRNFTFWNIEQHTIRGVELQGDLIAVFFTDLGLTWNIENEVCDEHSAMSSDWNSGRIPDCVRGGFVGGYLLSMVISKLSANGLIGALFLKLESVLPIIKKHQNIDFYDYMAKNGSGAPGRLSIYRNIPLEWGSITVFDMYLNW